MQLKPTNVHCIALSVYRLNWGSTSLRYIIRGKDQAELDHQTPSVHYSALFTAGWGLHNYTNRKNILVGLN